MVVPDPTTTSLASASDTRWNGAGGKSGTINGADFHASAVVKIDGVAATTAFVNSGQLTFTIPNTVFWTLGAKSITVENPTGSPSNAQSFTITQPSYVHLDMDPANGITLNGSTVQVMADQSGKGDANRNATQLTAANQPTYVASNPAYNNKPTLTCDGGDHMVTGTWTAPPANPVLDIWVGQNSAASNAYCYDGLVGTNRHALFRSSPTQVTVFAGSSAATSLWDSTTKAIAVSRYNGATGGFANSSKTITNLSVGTQTITGKTLFASNTAFSGKMNGTFARHIVVDNAVITAAQRGELLDYVGNEYGQAVAA